MRKLESKLKEAENQVDMKPTGENKNICEHVIAELSEHHEYVTNCQVNSKLGGKR